MAETPESGFGAGVGSGSTGSAVFYQSPKSVFGSEGPALSGARKVSLRAEIDTSPPFGSVKEAVTHFESSGAWIHLNKLGLGDAYMHDVGEIDIKKVEEQTLELEKNLIVKELETLDVLEELGTTKRMVEDLKWQLQKEALKCMTAANPEVMTPEIGEVNKENQLYLLNNPDKVMGSSSPCPMSSPDLILMELNQAKLNLGKTVNELGSIQTSVESLNKKIRKEKALLEKTRHKLTLKSAAELKQQSNNPPQCVDHTDIRIFEDPSDGARELHDVNFKPDRFEGIPFIEQSKNVMKTAEMKLAAAKKMEEAARAAEAVAIAEIKALSGNEESFDYLLSHPDNAAFSKAQSPMISKAQKGGRLPKRTIGEAFLQTDGSNSLSRVAILKKLDDAATELKFSKQALEEALQRVEIANRKQLVAGEALRRWNPEHSQRGPAPRLNHSNPPEHQFPMNSPLINLGRPENLANDTPKPVLRTTVSMRDILSRKQVLPDTEDYVPRSQTEGRKVALSQMLNELREDIRFPPRSDGNSHQKQFLAQRKKFGFIHISLPLAKPSRKHTQPSDVR